MRSSVPKHLHPLLGRRVVDWVIGAAGAGRRRPGRHRRLARHPRTPTRECRSPSRSSRSAPATPSRSARGRARGLRRPRTRARRGGAAADRRAPRRPRRRARASGCRGHDPDSFEPDAAAPVRPGRPRRRRLGRGDRRGEGRYRGAARDQGAQLVDLRVRGRPALGRRSRSSMRSNAQGELYLTDTIAHIVAGGRARSCLALPRRALAGLGINTRVELAVAARRAARPDQRGAHARRRDDRRPREHLDRRRRQPRGRRDDPPVHRARRERPRSPQGPRSAHTSSPSTPRSGKVHGRRTVLLPSPRHRSRGGSEGGHIRGDEEVAHRRPDRRCLTCRTSATPTSAKTRTSRRRQRHREPLPLARTAEGEDDDRQERQDRGGQYVRCSGHGWRRCLAFVRDGRHRRRPARIARRLPAEAGNQGRMGLRAWKARRTWRRLSSPGCRGSRP